MERHFTRRYTCLKLAEAIKACDEAGTNCVIKHLSDGASDVYFVAIGEIPAPTGDPRVTLNCEDHELIPLSTMISLLVMGAGEIIKTTTIKADGTLKTDGGAN